MAFYKDHKDIITVLVIMTITMFVTLILNAMYNTVMDKAIGGRYKTIEVHDTIYKTYPVIIYRDTCDSKFMRAIIETETRNYSKLAKGNRIYPSIGDQGDYIGFFQMSEIYFDGCDLAYALEYSYEDMFDPEKSFHVFWAKMGVYAERFKKDHKRLPTYEELARIHSGGYSNRASSVTDKYANYFNDVYHNKGKYSKKPKTVQ